MYVFVFRLSMFGNFNQYGPSTENSIKWTQELQELGYNLLPDIFQINVSGNNTPFVAGIPITGEKRMQFISADGNIAAKILPDRLDIEFSYEDIDSIESSFEEKCKIASNIMKKMISFMDNIKGVRLAYYADIMIPEIRDKTFNAFYNLNNLGIELANAEGNCIEWSHRFNRRVFLDVGQREEELCNAIFSMESGELQLNQSDIDDIHEEKGIRIYADINTLAENTAQRFSIDEFNKFIFNAQTLYFNIIKQLKAELQII